ncbi:hypothetical protein [Burkholderia sp. MBR-1]|uniref:hypothetical protein n=1 Tax=Burkholderia sp. MBR-1 TaxID=2732364 RepID=UPI0015EF6174|nr:hypothetical protein [Burkholderia sp. MBR-1]QMI49998.1 hypothetical protein MBR110_30230 [Burkholderia sp. MBR-1]
MRDFKLPIELPSGWTAEQCSFGVLLEAKGPDGRFIGGITVNEKVRGYALGISPVRTADVESSIYQGRGWREKLYRDAVSKLNSALVRK